MKPNTQCRITSQEYKDWQEQLRAEIREINFRMDYLLEVFRDQFGPFKPN